MSETDRPNRYQPFPSFIEWHEWDFDPTAVDRYQSRLQKAKSSAQPSALERAMAAAARSAAVDTNAIEGIYQVDRGFTRTVATQAAAWESLMEQRGSHARAAFNYALNGYEYVLDAATRKVEISELWIRELHQVICASQNFFTVFTEVGPQDHPLPKGVYKSMSNSPTRPDGSIHFYAPPSDTPAEMYRLIEELRSEAFLSSHPVLQAAYAHYAYVAIHPFADGNGRVARALASVYLYRSVGVPLVIFADQRNVYFDALEASDLGNSRPFVDFIATRTIDSIGMVYARLRSTAPPATDSLTGLHEIFDAASSDEDLIAGAQRVVALAVAELKNQIEAAAVPPQLDFRAGPGKVGPSSTPPPGYSGIGKSGCFYMIAECSWPVTVRQLMMLEVFVKNDATATSDLCVDSAGSDQGALEIWMREVEPVVSETLNLKLAGWLEGKVDEVLAKVLTEAQGGAI